LKPWDMAAGALLIEEAGGLVGGLSGEDDYLSQGHIVGGNARIFRAMQEMLKPYLQAMVFSKQSKGVKARKSTS